MFNRDDIERLKMPLAEYVMTGKLPELAPDDSFLVETLGRTILDLSHALSQAVR